MFLGLDLVVVSSLLSLQDFGIDCNLKSVAFVILQLTFYLECFVLLDPYLQLVY